MICISIVVYKINITSGHRRFDKKKRKNRRIVKASIAMKNSQQIDSALYWALKKHEACTIAFFLRSRKTRPSRHPRVPFARTHTHAYTRARLKPTRRLNIRAIRNSDNSFANRHDFPFLSVSTRSRELKPPPPSVQFHRLNLVGARARVRVLVEHRSGEINARVGK